MFAKLQLIGDFVDLVKAVANLAGQWDDLVPAAVHLVADGVSIIRAFDLAAAARFVADAKGLFAKVMVTYDGSKESVAAVVAAFERLIADAKA